MSDLLRGVRVVECAVLLNGDFIGMVLGDLGADVIKVESPGQGDYLRDMLGQITPHNSPAHVQVNKNKRSLTLDVRTDTGRELFFELLATADVFVDGFLAGTCDRLGIGYEEQRSRKPDIVYCHHSGFGGAGPYSRIPTHGQMMNALAAAVPLQTGEDGLVRRVESIEPMGGTTIGGDGTAAGGIHAVAHILAALVRRGRTGEGAYLDAAGADGVVAQGWIGAVYSINDERITDRRGLRPKDEPPLSGAKYQFYETKDERYILFCCIEHKFWARFCAVVDRPDLVDASETAGPVDFAHAQEDLRRQLQAVFATRTQQEWVDLAAAEDLPIGPAHQEAARLIDDPHLRTRQILVGGAHPDAGPFTYVGEAVVVDGERYELHRPAPALGEHTDEILAELGHGADEVSTWRAAGVV